MVHYLGLLHAAPYATGFFVCDLCREKGSGAVFHCSACNFDLHPTCIATGEQISHFSHSDHPLIGQTISGGKVCDVCGDDAFPSVYHCDECDFDAHPHCARAPRFIHHSWHSHMLQLTSVKDDAYSGSCLCNICGKKATDRVYHCSSCDFDLHIACATLPSNPYHSKHPEHRLKLFSRPVARLREVSCKECGKDASKWAYGCELCGFLLHVGCAKIPRHEVAPVYASILDAGESLTVLNDIETVVKIMERMFISSAASFTIHEGNAFGKGIKMLEQQLHGVPVYLAPVASRLTRDGDNNTCPTCKEEYASEKQRRYLRCGHHFHTSCILRWLDSSNRCPVCRQQVMFIDGL